MNALRHAMQAVALAVVVAAPGVASANPTGASVAHGSATFATPDAATLNITTSNGAIINWRQFGINPGEVTRFLQQGGSAAVLNRVVGGDPSAILGSLLSNGRVFLINPNGVVFGPHSVVDTAGLVVSTLNMTDDDFINGRLNFQGDGNEGAIVNQGVIHAQGSVILIAPRIENSGLIETDGGGLLLAAGREVTITSFENPEIAYQLQAPENEVVNLGQMITNGGAASVFAGSIRHSGDIDANSVVVDENGRVQLVAKSDVNIEAGSSITADGASGGEILVQSIEGTVMVEDATLSATGDAGRGGDIRVLGEQVGLTGTTTVDASGRDDGGQVLIGGDYLGGNPQVSNARFTFVGEDTRIDANAGTVGDGGKIILWADDSTRAHGTISATGGATSGDGGFVEISGKRGLVFQADVDTTATAGAAGTLLLDPDNITIIDGMGGSADGSLPIFTAVGVTTIGELALEGQATNVELVAADDIVLADLSDGQLSMFSLVGGESFTLRTTGSGSIIFTDVNDEIFTNGADIILEANGTGDLILGDVTTDGGSFTGGDITLTALGGDVTLNGVVQSGDQTGSVGFITGNSIASVGGGSITVGRLSLQSQTGINLTGNNVVEQLTADNAVSGNIDFNSVAGGLTLAADGVISASTAVENHAPGGLVQITASGDLQIDDLLTSANNISLDAGADISQLFAGAITANVLDVSNASTVDLSTANNQIVGVSAAGGIGELLLDNNSGGSALGLNDITALSGDIDITNSGGMSVIGTVDAGSVNNIRLDEQTGDINGAGGELLTASNIDLAAAGGVGNGTALHVDPLGTLTVNTNGTGGAGNVVVKFSNAAATSNMAITTVGGGQQTVYVETISGALTVDSAFGNTADAVQLNAANDNIVSAGGSVSGVSVNLTADGAIGTSGANSLKTQTGILNASSVTGGAIAIDNTGAVSVTGLGSSGAGLIELNQTTGTGNVSIDGAVNLTGVGPVRLAANNGALDVNADVTSDGLILLETTGGPTNDLSIGPGVNVQTSGVTSDVTVNSVGDVFHDGTVRSQQGDVVLNAAVDYNMGSAAHARADVGNSSINAGMGVILGALEAPSGAVSVTATGGAIVDGNGGSLNASGTSAGFAAMGGVGTTTNPLETQITSLTSATTSAGSIALANTGALSLVSGINVASGDLSLSSSTGLDTAFQNLSSSGAMTLNGGGGLLLIDFSTINAGTAFSANGADIDVNSATINGNTVLFNSSAATSITATSGPVSVSAADSATFNAGTTFKVEGGSSTGDDAKVNATNTVTINAADVIVKGGSASGAFASIDPTTITINATRDIFVQAGSVTNAYADIVADNLVNLSAGRNIDLIGDGDFAVIESNFGDVVINALGAVTLTAGSSGLGDAVIAANSGSGTVDITSSSCVNCVLLGFDPFASASADAGVFAAALNLMNPAAAAATGAAQGDSVDISDRDVLVLEDLAERLVAERSTGDDDDEDDEDQKICR